MARNQLFMCEMNPTHADNNGAEDTAEVHCSFHQLVYGSSDQLKLKTHKPYLHFPPLRICLHWEVKLDFYYNNLPLLSVPHTAEQMCRTLLTSACHTGELQPALQTE